MDQTTVFNSNGKAIK